MVTNLCIPTPGKLGMKIEEFNEEPSTSYAPIREKGQGKSSNMRALLLAED
jgi:hypothetical protein